MVSPYREMLKEKRQKTKCRRCRTKTKTHLGDFFVRIIMFNVHLLSHEPQMHFFEAFICGF